MNVSIDFNDSSYLRYIAWKNRRAESIAAFCHTHQVDEDDFYEEHWQILFAVAFAEYAS